MLLRVVGHTLLVVAKHDLLRLFPPLQLLRLPVLRRRLRQHLFSQGGLRAVYEQTLKYMAELLKVFGTQIALCVALAAAFIIERSRPNYGRLLAASTLSIALTQSFVLTVFVRDAGTLRAELCFF